MATVAERGATTVSEAIESRRSIRAFDPAPVPENDILEVMRLATLAPSSRNLQPWRFVAVTNEGVRRELRRAAHEQPAFATAPAIIAVYADAEEMLARVRETARPSLAAKPEALEELAQGVMARFGALSPAERAQFAVSQAFIAVGFLTLAARGLGYDTLIVGGFDEGAVKGVLTLPETARVVVLVAMGRPAEAGLPHHRLPFASVARILR